MKSIANQIHISKLFRSSLAMLVIIFLAGSRLLAQTPAPPQQQPIAITGGTIHTITNGVIIDGTVLFDNGQIIAVGTDVDVPENAEVIDASGKHVYPGLIHGQSTLGLTEIGRIAESTDLAETGNINPNIRAQVAFHSISEHIPVAALNGVTTVVPTPGGSLISGKPAAMMTDGWTWEQMTLREGIAMTINWPSMRDSDQYREDVEEIQQAFDKARRYQTARSAMEAGEGPHHPFDIRWEAMLPVLEGEMPVLVNVGDLRQIQAAIAWTEKENLDVILAGNRDFGLVADQLAEKGIPVMLTSIISGPDTNWEAYDQGYANPRKLYEAGVDFLIAGESSAAYAYRLPHHAASAVAFGLPEEEALKSITINAARILGIDDLVGSIEAGKDATLMITTGNPLELWTSNEQVFIQGRKLEMMDKHHRLYERYKEKHRQEHM